MKKVLPFFIVLLLISVLIPGCTLTTSTSTPSSASSLPDGMGKLVINITDPPVPLENVEVSFENLEIHKAGGPWTTIPMDNDTFELIELEGVTELLASHIVEAGIYTQIRLDVGTVQVSVTGDETAHEARVPSDKIKLVGSFEVVEGEETEITIDINGAKSVQTGKGEYIFRPVVKLLIPESAKPGNEENDEVETLSAVPGQSEDGALAEISTDPADPETKAIHLQTTGEVKSGNEARIVIDLPPDTTLDDIESISWWVWTESGYPPHVDIVMDHNGNGDVDDEDMLTAEMAYNNFAGSELDSIPPLSPTIGEWLQTFELTSGDGYGDINNDTMLWVAKMGSGNDDAPWGTLLQWKAGGVGVTNPPENGDILTGVIKDSAIVLRLEIEIDNWVLQSEAYVKGIEIVLDGTVYIVEF